MATKLDRKTLRFLKATAQNVYEPFFKNLLKPYKSSDPIAKAIFQILDDVHRLDQIVDKVIRNGVSIATMTDSILINNLVQKIEVNKDELLNVIANDEATKAHENVGTTPADLKFSQQFATGKETMPGGQSKQPDAFRSGAIGSTLSAFGINTGARVAGAAALGTIARPILGPYMYPAMAALAAAKLGPGMLLGGIRGAARFARGAYRFGKNPLGGVKAGVKGIGSGFKNFFAQMHPDYQAGGGASGGGFGGGSFGGGTYSTTGGGSLVHFFDKDWKKAKWTKDIYDALVDGKTKDKKKRGLGGLIVGAGIASLVAWVVADPDRLKTLTEKIEKLVSWAKEAWPKVMDVLPEKIDNLVSWASEAWPQMLSGIDALGLAVTTLAKNSAQTKKDAQRVVQAHKGWISKTGKALFYLPTKAGEKIERMFFDDSATEIVIPSKRPVESIQESPTDKAIKVREGDTTLLLGESQSKATDVSTKELTKAVKELTTTMRDNGAQSLENDPFGDTLFSLNKLTLGFNA